MAMISVPFVVVALMFVWLRNGSRSACVVWGLALMLFALPFFSPLMFLTGLLLLTARLCGWIVPENRLLGIVMCAALLPMVYGTIRGSMNVIEQRAARQRFPVTSLRPRLVTKNEAPITLANVRKYKVLESAMELDRRWWGSRERALRTVHQSAVAHFLSTPEFGVTRMGYPDLRRLSNDDGSPIELPLVPVSNSSQQTTYVDSTPTVGGDGENSKSILSKGHAMMQSWFLDPERLGLVEDLDHVTGFQSHAFRSPDINSYRLMDLAAQTPFPTIGKLDDTDSYRYRLEKLQLIGLLYHDEPVVYDLTTMPDLVHADSAMIRQLDDFESTALSELQSGEPITFKRYHGELRMLGGIRNGETCVECHQESTDTLLGAFTYTLSVQGITPELVDQLPALAHVERPD